MIMRNSLAALAVFAACVAAPVSARAQENVYDPYENFNRHLYAFNDRIDKAVLEPVARGYRAVTPHFVRTGVSTARFGVNTTVGILGFCDPAQSMGLPDHDEDFGQTLAVWGVKSGPYFFVPLLGPTSLRDGVGRIVDLGIDPLTWAHYPH